MYVKPVRELEVHRFPWAEQGKARTHKLTSWASYLLQQECICLPFSTGEQKETQGDDRQGVFHAEMSTSKVLNLTPFGP